MLFNRSYSPLRLAILGTFVICMVACSSNKPAPQLTEKEYYDLAQKSFKSGNFNRAGTNLELLESYYPVGTYTDQAQLEQVYAKYRYADFVGASTAAERFIRLHPNHAQIDYAYYIKGIAEFDAQHDSLSAALPVKPGWRDLDSMRDSFNTFQELIRLYPNSSYVADARARMIYIRNLFAENEWHVAIFDAQKQAYIGSLNRAKTIIENYPGSPQSVDAVALNVFLYQKLKMPELAQQQQKILDDNYPGYKNADKIRKTIEEKSTRSWAQIISFGLIK
jgi:outer membrane protein assembly factor BamD